MRYHDLLEELRSRPKRWLVTGAAGFIGSNLLEALLENGQRVVGLDNLSTGYEQNLGEVRSLVGQGKWKNFEFIKGDIRDPETCVRACRGIDKVLHQAAIGSVPISVEDPGVSHGNNLTGFLNVILAARDAGVERFVYASSSAVYGKLPGLPKTESMELDPLSPYAATKIGNELYAKVFAECYGLHSIGLRYFNIYGPRQDPNGAYAAVIPRWFYELISGRRVSVYGDGETSRDFCYVRDCVQASILAACAGTFKGSSPVYNVARGKAVSLNRLLEGVKEALLKMSYDVEGMKPVYEDFRAGDIRHSSADIGLIRRELGFSPAYDLQNGLEMAEKWYSGNLKRFNGA